MLDENSFERCRKVLLRWLLGAVCCFVSAVSVRIGCFAPLPSAVGLVRVLPFLCCWSALMGRLSVLECALWGFPLLLALLHLFPPLRLFAKHSPQLYSYAISALGTCKGVARSRRPEIREAVMKPNAVSCNTHNMHSQLAHNLSLIHI